MGAERESAEGDASGIGESHAPDKTDILDIIHNN